MNYNVAILGSTGSIGYSTLLSLKNKKNFKIELLTTKSNAIKILKQALKFQVKNVIISDKKKYLKYKDIFKEKKINLYFGLENIQNIVKKKISYTINAITGIDGLEPTLQIIPFSKNILIANKESIICGWEIIQKKLKRHKTKFIPIDSEHFSIWKLIETEKNDMIEKVILTASGGPFLNKSKKKIKNINPKYALNHPNWKMGKKISIDSSTMMNKVFEFIEAKKIFNLDNKNISILIHPTSFVHAIVFFKGNIIKLLAHDTKMTIPIANALGIRDKLPNNIIKYNLEKLNNLKFYIPKNKQFPILSILKMLPKRESYFETILITINDLLVNKYLKGSINYVSIQRNLINIIKSPYFKKYYKLKPKNIYDIKKMRTVTKKYLNSKLKYYYD